MSDTAPEIEKRYREMLMRLTPEQKASSDLQDVYHARSDSQKAQSETPRLDQWTTKCSAGSYSSVCTEEKSAVHSGRWSSRDPSLNDQIVTRASRGFPGYWRTFAPRHLVSALNAFGLFARQLARAGTRIRVGCRWHALRVANFLYGGLRDAQ